jgi:hypothetical protein
MTLLDTDCLQDSFTYSIRNNLNVTSTSEATVRNVKRPKTFPDPYILVPPNSSIVIDVLKNDDPELRIMSVQQPAPGFGTVAIVNCSSLQGEAATDSPDCLLYTAGNIAGQTQVCIVH